MRMSPLLVESFQRTAPFLAVCLVPYGDCCSRHDGFYASHQTSVERALPIRRSRRLGFMLATVWAGGLSFGDSAFWCAFAYKGHAFLPVAFSALAIHMRCDLAEQCLEIRI